MSAFQNDRKKTSIKSFRNYVENFVELKQNVKGIFIPREKKEDSKNIILITPNMPPNVERATIAKQTIHLFKAEGLIEWDVPMASAIGYLERWFLEKKSKTKPKNKEEEMFLATDDWELVIALMNFGRKLAKDDEQTLTFVSEMLEIYDENPSEDRFSYRWGAILAGIALELFNESHELAMGYIANLTKGMNHNEAKSETKSMQDKR